MATRLPPVIGFTGRAGSGKSTAAKWVVANHRNAMPMSFAAPLKHMTIALIRTAMPKKWDIQPSDYVYDPLFKNEPIPFLLDMTPRRIMQTLGTEWGRESVHPDFWVAVAAAKLERMLSHSFHKGPRIPIKAVYDDLRFANEAAMIRAYDGIVVRIIRPGEADADTAAHASEQFDFEPDVTIVNDGTLKQFERKVQKLLPVPKELPPMAGWRGKNGGKPKKPYYERYQERMVRNQEVDDTDHL